MSQYANVPIIDCIGILTNREKHTKTLTFINLAQTHKTIVNHKFNKNEKWIGIHKSLFGSTG